MTIYCYMAYYRKNILLFVWMVEYSQSELKMNDDTRSLVVFLCATTLRYFRGSEPNAFDNVQNITIDIQKLLTWFKSLYPDTIEGIFLHPEAAVGYEDFWKTVTTIETTVPERILNGFYDETKNVSRYIIPKNEDFIGNIKVTCPDSCRVEFLVDERKYWESQTEPNVPLKMPKTLNMSKLGNHVTEIRLYRKDLEKVKVTFSGRVVKDLAERAMYLTRLSNCEFFEANTPEEWK